MKTIQWLALSAGASLIGAAAMAQAPVASPTMDHNGKHHEMGEHAGHEMHGDGGFHRRFDNAAEWAKKFDDPARDAWQKPDEVVDALKLSPSTTVADIGAGTGYFAMRIARRVPQGRVFAADLEADMVRYLGDRAKREGLTNVVPVQAGPDSANLSEPVDLILLVDTYHHVGNRIEYFRKLQSSLKPGGRIAIVDFRMDSPEGPPPEHRVALEKASEELKAAGFKLIDTQTFLPRQYLAIFQKSGA